MSEWLLDYHATPEGMLIPRTLVLIGQLCSAELLHDGAKKATGDGEVEDNVALCAVSFLRSA